MERRWWFVLGGGGCIVAILAACFVGLLVLGIAMQDVTTEIPLSARQPASPTPVGEPPSPTPVPPTPTPVPPPTPTPVPPTPTDTPTLVPPTDTPTPVPPTDTPTSVPPTPVPPTPTSVPPTPTDTPVPGPVAGETRVWDKDGSVVVYIPPGEFLMGLSLYPDGNEYPQHTVYVDGFWIGKYEVTMAQYRRCVEAGACKKPVDRDWYRNPDYANCPAVYVRWRDMQAYAQWAGGRLPTEAEWEKAARGTDGLTYPWGDVWDPSRCNTKGGGPGEVTPVGKYSPAGDSPYGVSDMAGNAWEWTSSLLRPYPYNPGDGREDPNSTEPRVARGGGWSFVPDTSRSWFRYVFKDDDYGRSLGFRLVYPVTP
jgi:formylglycine-generating enzyme required for sulfatase activity